MVKLALQERLIEDHQNFPVERDRSIETMARWSLPAGQVAYEHGRSRAARGLSK